MLWIILAATGLLFCLVSFWVEWDNDVTSGAFVWFAIFGVVCVLIFSIHGCTANVGVPATKEYAIAECAAVEQVKEAHYNINLPESALVGGSLDNLKQSSNLTETIQRCAHLKGRWNSRLVWHQQFKQSIIGYWFFGSMVVSDEIMKMEPIK
jgi:hypothetical protein